MLGTLQTEPARTRPDLLAAPVVAGLAAWTEAPDDVLVAPIDPDLADTAAFCEAYQVGLDISANCVVVTGKRGGQARYAACVILATTRADVNTVVRQYLDVRKASFAPMADTVARTGMESGGITPIGGYPATGRSWSTGGSPRSRTRSSAPGYATARSPSRGRPWPRYPTPRYATTWLSRLSNRRTRQ